MSSSDFRDRMTAPPPPRGILKNKDGSSRFSDGPPPQVTEIHDPRLVNSSRMMNNPPPSLNINVGSGGGEGWMMTGGGSNVPNPNMEALEQPNRQVSLRQKMNDFVTTKHDMLFKPLAEEEMPLADVKGYQLNVEDHYGMVPSLDHFLRVDSSEIKRYFFQNLQVGDILIGSVHSRGGSGISIKLLSTDVGKHIVLEDLGIKAFCHTSSLIPMMGDKGYDYQTGDYVRVEVTEVNPDSEKIVCGMKGVTLAPELLHTTFHLGRIDRHDLPRQYLLAKSESEQRNHKNYEQLLTTTNGFQNPNSIGHLASTMGILSHKNSLMVGLRNDFPEKESASNLRRIQNGKWAHGNVADGIKYFKSGKFTEAFQCLNKALQIDAENVEALVARGALYANNGGFEKAIEDFETALKYNPTHYNARKYHAETLVALGKQQESAQKFEDAVASYSKCLVVKPDQKEAKDALWSLYDKTNKLDITKLPPPAVQKLIELKEKLKVILQSEFGMNVDTKHASKEKDKDSSKKAKRKKGKRSSGSEDESSSSSSSDSDSDSSDDESDKGRKRKKSKKKKKKGKKAKKEKETKGRHSSLSPFSKRFADAGQSASGLGLAGFADSSFAEWGHQLGLAKTEKKEESDDESKHSSKRSKEKKRSKKKEKRKKKKRSTSSSSESDSGESSSRDRRKEKKKPKVASSSAAAHTSQFESNITNVIPDLGDLEAKLSAYYSKMEQEKLEPAIPPKSLQVTVDRGSAMGYDGYGNEPVRKIEVKIEQQPSYSSEPSHHMDNTFQYGREVDFTEGKQGKISLMTDDYGNFIEPANIIRTVHNEPPAPPQPVPEPKPVKFEIMRSRGQEQQHQQAGNAGGGGGGESKWRPFGAAPPPEEKPVIKNPFELQKFDKGKDDRNYRGRKSRSPALSPRKGGRGGGARRGRSRSRSRSGSSRSSSSSSRGSRSRSRSKSRDRSGRGDRRAGRLDRDRFDRDRGGGGGGDRRGRGAVRFFRGYNNTRGSRRPFPPRGRYRPNGPSNSRFRNRFSRSFSRSRSRSRSSRSASKSRSRSKSRSKSPDRGSRRRDKDRGGDRDRDRSRPTTAEDKGKDKTRPPPTSSGHADPPSDTRRTSSSTVDIVAEASEIQIGELTTTKASEVEELLDKRNAEKKEEMRKSNPEFFRNN